MVGNARGKSDGLGHVPFVDVLRLIAAVQMLQGHSVDAVLGHAFRNGSVYGVWTFARGLTSVSFLFVAGLAFHLATLRDLQAHLNDRAAVLRRFRRGGLLVATGYLLHLPVGALFATSEFELVSQLQGFLVADVLQCIGITLIVIESLAVWLKSPAKVMIACGLLGSGILAFAGQGASLTPTLPWSPLTNYLSSDSGSIFPLLPWAAHMLFGVCCGALLNRGNDALWLGMAAVLSLAAAALSGAAGLPVVEEHLGRLGWVVAGSAVLVVLSSDSLPPWALRLSRETLFIYVFHILLVYGHGLGLSTLVGPSLGPLNACLLALVVIIVSCAAALNYRRPLAFRLAAAARSG